MTILPNSRDTDGVLLNNNITLLTAAIANQGNALTKHSMSLKLDQLQRELVAHYLDVGRLNAATILANLT